ncbi:LysM peptidoglycan-binding domain-containing protein [Paenibacillus sp. N1-5-1-14]|uniref:LysM peptidoglycan-binding domain-containing protein n=1 Tax=Paenibacillus radicibacter TaxID=2972488 RepID=UPI0021590697|nr:LysM peptidoglycan-binding domain-containing protein [Paenibacillus radicibacter]MCR8645568.1 LysM peptidoglycan-binding domain-containing protein [Paenibacillus radicibacter]
MEYGIWLSFNNQEEGFQIPINPESLEISESGSGETYDIGAIGEINVIKSPQLAEYKFQGIFPAMNYPFVITKFLLKPMQYVGYIKKWMGTRRPIRFVYIGTNSYLNGEGKTISEVNEAVSIEKFDWNEVAGSPGDIEYSITLKKYVFYAAKKAVYTENKNTGELEAQQQSPERPSDKQQPKTYTLVAGDNLSKVSKKVLGDDWKWPEIQKLNGITDAQLKNLQIGMVLKMP